MDEASVRRSLPAPEGEFDERSRRARTEAMAVRGLGSGTYTVDTAGGNYLVDLPGGRCTCPDHRFRGVRCKHLRRVAIEVTAGRAPPPDRVARPCRDCAAVVFVEAGDAGPHYCRAHRVAPGDHVRDRETGHRLVVVTPPGGRAEETPIPGQDATVAEHPTNAGYEPDQPVVGAVYPGGRVTESGVSPRDLRVYAFPRARLRRVDPHPGRPTDGAGRWSASRGDDSEVAQAEL
jgi:hypothetical protein